MDYRTAAADFLRKHSMHPEQTDAETFCRDFILEMNAGLAGEPSSIGMFPAYLSCEAQPLTDTPVLVVDAGGTNLRCARMRFQSDGRVVTEAVRKSRMPGTRGETADASELFETIARELIAVGADCERACISFSYPCEVLPNADGRMLRLTKELHVTNLVGALVCEQLETALQRLGASGKRSWRLINDTVGSMLGGMAQCQRDRYDDFVGLILGTGTNTCGSIAARDITKSPAAMAMGGDVVVNLESGGFNKMLRGSADMQLDAESVQPGRQWLEKMISGGYYPQLLKLTLFIAAKEGLCSQESVEALCAGDFGMREVDMLCSDAAEEKSFAREVNALLLERSAKLTACALASIIRRRSLKPGSRVCICSDGTTIEKNPLLRPLSEKYLAALLERDGVHAEFFQVSDATLQGSAYAGLL